NENDANEVRAIRQRFPDPLTLLANTYNLPPSYNSQKSQYNPQPSELFQYQLIIPPPQEQSYEPPIIQQQSPTPSTQLDSGFLVPSFLPTDDLIANLNKAMMFLSNATNLIFPPTNNQLRTSSNPGTQATIQDGRVTKNEEQQDFMDDGLEELDSDWDDLQLNTTSIFKADHVDAFDSNCDEVPTASAIFTTRLSPAASDNGDSVQLMIQTYHL
nr:hypothetical protein [Tanacetum cinerariifolium]